MNLAWASVVGLLIAGVLLGSRAEIAYRHQAQRQAQVQAEILAASVTAALAFDDRPTIREYVDALRVNPQVAIAAVYDAAGDPVVTYARNGSHAAPPRIGPPGSRTTQGVVRVTTPVTEHEVQLGKVYVETLPEPLSSVLARHSGLGLLLVMAFLLLGLITRAAAQLQRRAEQLADANARLQVEMAERERAEEALRQSQKMESLGQLTGGVAHDFNNLLTVIMGGLETIGRHLAKLPSNAENARLHRARDMAMYGAERAATLTARLLAFSRRQPLQPQAIDPNRLVNGMSELLQRTLGETVTLQIVLGAGLWRTHADPGQLENAVLNLAVNARDAMEGGGRLTIETANASLDSGYVEQLPETLAAGQYVLIAVTDTGSGMDEETVTRAFEPFFTTKDVGKGTGLGLSQVYGFVRQSGGVVRIYSEPGQGTTVKIYLPRFLGAEQEIATPRALDASTLLGDEVVLLVEDHDELRAYSSGILRELGYQVHEAADGASALEVMANIPDIVLLFTDVVLPGGMNGRQLADKVREARPELKVLFTTGYTRNAIVHNGTLDPGVELITKPFSFDDLAVKLRHVLDA
ncbi:ATP-binding protein [Phenylobacterium hankyongense]|uniref:ATP-binding protein n=1 Tax=Phenylobacterium hankyongense TaxID=1813876 RepID=UPI001A9D663F|nr:ATP-binding protein [Phenylobacterium hankyongense]